MLKYHKNIIYVVIDLENDKVPNITISLNKEEKQLFDKLCEDGTRGPSAQVKHMMKFFINHKDKVK